MKKILSYGLLFSLFLSLLVGCVKAPDGTSSNSSEGNIDNNSSAALEEIDINDWYNADFLTEDEKKSLFEQFKADGSGYHLHDLGREEYWNIFRCEYSSSVDALVIDTKRGDEWAKEEEKILLDNVGVKYLNINMMGEKEREAYTQYRLTRMPMSYEMINRLKISKEDLIKANNKRREEIEKSISEGHAFSLEELTFTDEEIDLLYSGDKDAIREHFMGAYTFLHENKTYDPQYFWDTEPERWAKENIPIETLNEWIEKLEEADIENYIRPKIYPDKQVQKIVLETYFIKQKIKEYEALLAAE